MARSAITEPHAGRLRRHSGDCDHLAMPASIVNIAGNDQPTYMTDATTGAVVLNEAAQVRRPGQCCGHPLPRRAMSMPRLSPARPTPSGTARASRLTVTPPARVRRSASCSLSGRRCEPPDLHGDRSEGRDRHVHLGHSGSAAGNRRRLTVPHLAFPGPYGSFNWAFHRDAIALVSRPLAMPNNQMGVLTQVGVHNDISMRVAMQYDIDAGGTKVNLDLLCGVAVLDQPPLRAVARLSVCFSTARPGQSGASGFSSRPSERTL